MSGHPKGLSKCDHCGGSRIRQVGNSVEGCPWCKNQPAEWESQQPARPDPVNHPSHYTQGDIECIDALEAIGIGPDFCRGNAIKYLWRAGMKGDPLEDARKAQWYINRLVQELEQER